MQAAPSLVRPRLALLTSRPSRVAILLCVVTALSLTDLYLTVYYASTIGFAEANPLARWVMALGCPWLLSVWKIMLVAITFVSLWFTRRFRIGEFGAWTCLLVMIWLIARWHTYTNHIHDNGMAYIGDAVTSAEFVKFGGD